MTHLAFLRLSDARFGEILPLLLPSCSHVTYIANTQWVMKRSRAADERRFSEISASSLPFKSNTFVRTGTALFGRKFHVRQLLRNGGAMKNKLDVKSRCHERARNHACGARGLCLGALHLHTYGQGGGEAGLLGHSQATYSSSDAPLPKESDSKTPRGTQEARIATSGEPRHSLDLPCACEVLP